jgi:hypothetical protein
MKNNNSGTIEFFQSLSDELMVQLALNDWEALESLCIALTLDHQMVVEYYKKEILTKEKKKGLAS